MFIYHITSKSEWQQAQAKGEYLPANYSADGFIHCSKKEQVVQVANRAYTQKSGLVLLKIDTSLLRATVKEENLEGGSELFPHIYGPLPVKAVNAWADFPCDTSGFIFPPGCRVELREPLLHQGNIHETLYRRDHLYRLSGKSSDHHPDAP